MSEQRPTPETDAEQTRFNNVDSFDDRFTVPADFARNLERRRDEAREEIAAAKAILRQVDLPDEPLVVQAKRMVDERDWQLGIARGQARQIEQANENLRAMREQIEETHAFLDADPSKIIRNAQDGYPEGRQPHELSLKERVEALAVYAADWKRWDQEAREQLEAMRVAVKEAHRMFQGIRTRLQSCGDGRHESLSITTDALAKLQPFIQTLNLEPK